MRIVVLVIGIVGVGVACGTSGSSDGPKDASTNVDANTTTPEDASNDAAQLTDGATCVEAPADAVIPEQTLERCDGGSYMTAPSGAACEATHIVGAGIKPKCSALPKGDYCDTLTFSLPSGSDSSAVPASFACQDSAYCGWKDCHLTQPGQSGTHVTLDDAALEAACAITAAYPNVRVTCFVYGP